MNPKQLRSAILHLRNRGIEFLVPSRFGLAFGDVDAVLDYCRDPDSRLAREYGIELPLYRAWKAWRDGDGRCRSPDCGDPVEASVLTTPADFQPGRTDRCRRHQTTEPPA